jgi:hypothetical protein
MVDGELTGGWWIAPGTESPLPDTHMVIIDTTDEMLDWIAAQSEHWLYVEDVEYGITADY